MSEKVLASRCHGVSLVESLLWDDGREGRSRKREYAIINDTAPPNEAQRFHPLGFRSLAWKGKKCDVLKPGKRHVTSLKNSLRVFTTTAHAKRFAVSCIVSIAEIL